MSEGTRLPATKLALFGAILVLSLAADLGSKEWALSTLSAPVSGPARNEICEEDEVGLMHMERMRRPSIVLIEDHLEFRYAENCGAAFGLMHKAPRILRVLLFGVTAIGVSMGLLVMLYRGRRGALFNWSVPLIVSGAIGNFADRLRHGYVVDFIRAYAGNHEWPTFNIADATISVGIVLMLIEGLREKAPVAAAATEPTAPADAPLD